MKKVLLAEVYTKINYGTVLQAYALQRFMDEKKVPNEVIYMDGFSRILRQRKFRYYVRNCTNISLYRAKRGLGRKVILERLNYAGLRKKSNVRKRLFQKFINENLHFSPSFYNLEALAKYAKEYGRAVVVGSDQLWLPVNIAGDFYTLSWVPDQVPTFSYATSFGVSEIPLYQQQYVKDFLTRLNAISVRELRGQSLVERLAGVQAQVVCDPTMLISVEVWRTVASSTVKNEDYILCYFLGKNPIHRSFACKLRQVTGFKIVALVHLDEYIASDENYADETPFDVGPAEFLSLIRDAKYICTDSFHGTVFSILFEKIFFTFSRFSSKEKMSTNARIDTLLNSLNLGTRRFTGEEEPAELLKIPLDYTLLRERMKTIRRYSENFLLQKLQIGAIKLPQTVAVDNPFDCCGCGACSTICPTNSIKMEADSEGFLYPTIDSTTCVLCGLCVKCCPILNTSSKPLKTQLAFIAQNKNNVLRQHATSGGVFGAIAEEVISRGGIVFGAQFDEQYNVIHTSAENREKLEAFYSSKYVQSNTNNTFAMVKYWLQMNRFVCYSGTPCQIEGLRHFLNQEYDNLLLVDVVCRGVPSPLIWKEYCRMQCEKEYSAPEAVWFRDKSQYGYQYTQMRFKFPHKNIFLGGVDCNPYLRSFFENVNVRPSCFECRFRSRYRNSDLTLWDCLDIRQFSKTMDINGTTRVLVHNLKGEAFFNSIRANLIYEAVDCDKVAENVQEMKKNKVISPLRSHFFESMQQHGVNYALQKFYAPTLFTKLEHLVRIISYRFHIYGVVKYWANKIRKNR